VYRVQLRFYAELNDFLSPDRRQKAFTHHFSGRPSIKDAIESLGVPHMEVDLVLVNGVSVGFDHHLADGDFVSVYPMFESLDISPVIRLRPEPLRHTAFVLDVHLGKLARLLRLLGFDTLYERDYDDAAIVDLAVTQGRIILTRDRGLLKRRQVTHGYWLRSTDPVEQAREVVRRFDLHGQAKPLTRCARCNGTIEPVDKNAIRSQIPPQTASWCETYYCCATCGQVYWRGTHFQRLQETIAHILKKTESRDDIASNHDAHLYDRNQG
jgi:uncharacterized protein with PIN domain